MPSAAAVSPSRRRWATIVSARLLGRLAGAGDADADSEPARREADPPLGQLDSLGSAEVGPADVAAADLDACAAPGGRTNDRAVSSSAFR